jgi:hypothetical protein
MNRGEGDVYRLLVGKSEGKRALERPSCRWVDNTRLALGEVEWGAVDWIGLPLHRDMRRALVNAVINLWVP